MMSLCQAPTNIRPVMIAIIVLVLGFCLPHMAVANLSDELDSQLKSENLTLEDLKQRITTLEKTASSDTTPKVELNALYQTRDFLQKSLAAIEQAQTHYQAYQGVPLRINRIEQELASALPTEAQVNARESLNNLEQQLEHARNALNTARSVRNEIEIEATQRSERLQKIAEESANARKRQEELTSLLSAPVNGDKEKAAKQHAIQAEQDYLKYHLKALEQEQQSYEARRELIRARRQQAERQILITEQQFTALEQAVNQRRTTAAAKVMQSAEETTLAATSASVHPLVHVVVENNQQFATELTQVLSLNTQMSEEKKTLDETLTTLRRQYDGIKEKIAQIGLTDAIGLKLRNDRSQLPNIKEYTQTQNQRRIDIGRVQLRRIEIEERLLTLIDLNKETQQLINHHGLPAAELETLALSNALSFVLGEQRDQYLNELIKAYDIHFDKHLFPMMETERELIALITEYREFIDTRILWIQSTSTLGIDHIQQLGITLPWLLNPTAIINTLNGLRLDMGKNPISTVLLILSILLLMGFRTRIKNKLSQLGRYVTKLSKAKFTDTLKAALITLLLVLPWPLMIYLLAWRTEQLGNEDAYAMALSSGGYTVAYLLFLGLLLRCICRPSGLGEAHFRWEPDTLLLIRRQLTWFLPTSLPLAFIVAMTFAHPVQSHHDSLGRFAFITLMLATSLLIYQLLKPTTGLFKNDIKKYSGGWLDRLSNIWFPLLVSTPIGITVAAMAGYFYTAIQLCIYSIGTLGLFFIAYMLREFFIRWLNITQRKLTLEQWLKKREVQFETDADDKPESPHPVLNDEPNLDVETISTQTMRLINSAYWLTLIIGTFIIWSEVLPALSLLNDIVLWHSEVSSGGTTSTFAPTTLANLLLAFTILLMTFFISRNIPGLLEIAVLQHLPFTPSGRYAITTITRYMLVIVGLTMTFNAIGIGWSKVQWLAAAITVGLGFGLQEIFANFVSGLIILFERQIRVGDSVTVGNTSGIVSRIQMRATTITDWDRKELIIPNKEFVTGQVINWSLSDTILRVVIPVGIAYGSDTQLAYDTLLATAHDHPDVLDEPQSRVRFMAFGESSLDFELRVYIPHPDLLLDVRHQLHMEIDKRFRKAKIEIAFPQRDIHVKAIPENLLGRNPRTSG